MHVYACGKLIVMQKRVIMRSRHDFGKYIKEKRFTIKDYGSYGLSKVLVTPISHKPKVFESKM